MIKSKKLLLGSLATVAMVATPIAAVVSCGPKKSTSSSSMLKFIKMEDSAKKDLANNLKAMANETEAQALTRIQSVIMGPFVKEDKKTQLTDADKKAVNDAKTPEAAYKAVKALIDKGLYIHMPKSPATINFGQNKKITFDKMDVTKAEYEEWAKNPNVATDGSAATTGTTPATPYADQTNTPQGTGSQTATNTNSGTTTTTTTTTTGKEVNTVLKFKEKLIDLGKFVPHEKITEEVKKQVHFNEATKEINIKATKDIVYGRIKDSKTRATAIISQIKMKYRSDAKGTQFTDTDFKAITDGTDTTAQNKAIDEFMKKDIFTSSM